MWTGGQVSDMLPVLLLLCTAGGVWGSAPTVWEYGQIQDRQGPAAPLCPSPCQCEEDGIFVMVDCSELGLSSVPTNLSPLTTYLWVTHFLVVLSCHVSFEPVHLEASHYVLTASLTSVILVLCFLYFYLSAKSLHSQLLPPPPHTRMLLNGFVQFGLKKIETIQTFLLIVIPSYSLLWVVVVSLICILKK